jgi:hypothetical protein
MYDGSEHLLDLESILTSVPLKIYKLRSYVPDLGPYVHEGVLEV